jgi:RHS repeat-associated protein
MTTTHAYDEPQPLHFSAVSNLMNKFTSKERDAETGLDYFGARYYSAPQGRFMRPDPLLSSGRPFEPQSWNRYAYVLNNPLKYSDPAGLYEFADCNGDAKCLKYQDGFRKALGAAKSALDSGMLSDEESESLSTMLNYLGDEGPGKGHGRIVFGSLNGNEGGAYLGNDVLKFDMGKLTSLSQRKDVGNQKYDLTTIMAGVIAHEVVHDYDDSKGILPMTVRAARYNQDMQMIESSERHAYDTESFVFKGLNATDPGGLWRTNWVTEGLSKVDKETLRSIGVERGVKRSMDDIKQQIRK